MKVIVYTKRGEEIHQFDGIDEIREYEGYYEIIPEIEDRPRCRVYGKKNVILIKF